MKWALLLFATVTGVLNTIQSGNNTTLVKTSRSPVWSAAIVFSVALTSTLVAALVGGQRPPAMSELRQVPWWGFCGGVLGATYVLSMMVVAPKVGAALFMGVTVSAAVITSLVMDHFGLLGFEEHRAGGLRVAGGVLMVAGLGLIAKG